jgi:hypothetical protein
MVNYQQKKIEANVRLHCFGSNSDFLAASLADIFLILCQSLSLTACHYSYLFHIFIYNCYDRSSLPNLLL